MGSPGGAAVSRSLAPAANQSSALVITFTKLVTIVSSVYVVDEFYATEAAVRWY
jgi:hypothetical protein